MNYWIYQNKHIQESDYFIYEVLIYVYQDNTYYLYESKQYRCNQYIENIIEYSYHKYSKFSIEKEIQLVKAPISWLKENAQYYENK